MSLILLAKILREEEADDIAYIVKAKEKDILKSVAFLQPGLMKVFEHYPGTMFPYNLKDRTVTIAGIDIPVEDVEKIRKAVESYVHRS